jgi:hypothetical protein
LTPAQFGIVLAHRRRPDEPGGIEVRQLDRAGADSWVIALTGSFLLLVECG